MAGSAEEIEMSETNEPDKQAAAGHDEPVPPDQPVHCMEAGLAFSGGGIRSAALCSGVLRRILQLKTQPGYLSCVSGGGYTGTAYIDWKYRNENAGASTWHNEFFNHMRRRAGYICDWQNCCQGFWCGPALIVVMLILNLGIAIVGVGSAGFLLAFVIDYSGRIGGILRQKKYECGQRDLCEPPDRKWVFFGPLVVAIVLWLIRNVFLKGYKVQLIPKIIESLLFLFFAFTFLPWFIHDYLDDIHILFQLVVVVLSAVIWFFAPLLRRYSSLVILIYCVSYQIYWRVYKEDISPLMPRYTEERFIAWLLASGMVLGFASCFGAFHLKLVHIYNRSVNPIPQREITDALEKHPTPMHFIRIIGHPGEKHFNWQSSTAQ